MSDGYYGSGNLRADGGETDGQYADAIDRPDADSWDCITVMQGPDVSGRARIRFGRWETHEKMDEDGKVYVAAELLETIPLPRPMTRPEIEEWLEEGDWGEKILEKYDETDGPSSTETDRSGGQP